MKLCCVQGCDAKAIALGLCAKHRQRLARGRSLIEEPQGMVEPRRIVIVLENSDYQALKKRAEEKDVPTATHIRNLLTEVLHG